MEQDPNLADEEETEDIGFVRLLETNLLRKRTALQLAQEEIRRLREQIEVKDKDRKAKEREIDSLKLQVREANGRATKALEINKVTGSDPHKRLIKGLGPCPTCQLDPGTILDLQEKDRKSTDRMAYMVDRQRDLEQQLSRKTREVDDARQLGFNDGRRAARNETHRQPSRLTHSATPQISETSGNSFYHDLEAGIGDSDASSTEPEEDESLPLRQTSLSRTNRDRQSSKKVAYPDSDNVILEGIAAMDNLFKDSDAPKPVEQHQRRPQETPTAQRSFGHHEEAIIDYEPDLSSQPDRFSSDFVEYLTGNKGQLLSSRTDGTALDRSKMGFEKLIIINKAYQKKAPEAEGEDGSVVFIDGEPHCSNHKGAHPALVSSHDGTYAYFGNYDVLGSSTEVALDTWKKWPAFIQRSFAGNIINNAWGTRLLQEKNLLSEIEREDDLEEKIKKVLGFFSRVATPNLRLRAFSLRHAWVSRTDYKDICSAWDSYRTRQDEKATARKTVSGNPDAGHSSRNNIDQDGKGAAAKSISRTPVASIFPSRNNINWRKSGGNFEDSLLKRKNENAQQTPAKRQRDS